MKPFVYATMLVVVGWVLGGVAWELWLREVFHPAPDPVVFYLFEDPRTGVSFGLHPDGHVTWEVAGE